VNGRSDAATEAAFVPKGSFFSHLELECNFCGEFFSSPLHFPSSDIYLDKDHLYGDLVLKCPHCRVKVRWGDLEKRRFAAAGGRFPTDDTGP